MLLSIPVSQLKQSLDLNISVPALHATSMPIPLT